MAKKRTRKSVKVKEQAVLRLLRGEDLDLVSRQTGLALHELSRWRDKFIMGGRESLKSRPQDPLNAEWEQRDKLISRLALENEILKKAGAIVLPPWNPANRDYAACAVARAKMSVTGLRCDT